MQLLLLLLALCAACVRGASPLPPLRVAAWPDVLAYSLMTALCTGLGALPFVAYRAVVADAWLAAANAVTSS